MAFRIHECGVSGRFGKFASFNDRYKDHKPTSTFFADWSLNAHFHCFRYENANFSSVYVDAPGNSKSVRVADSVPNFFELYLTNPRSVYV